MGIIIISARAFSEQSFGFHLYFYQIFFLGTHANAQSRTEVSSSTDFHSMLPVFSMLQTRCIISLFHKHIEKKKSILVLTLRFFLNKLVLCIVLEDGNFHYPNKLTRKDISVAIMLHKHLTDRDISLDYILSSHMSLEFMLKPPYNAIFMTDFCGLTSFQFSLTFC